MKTLALVLLLSGCASAPVGMKTANPNCLWHCVISMVDAPEAATVTATQNGATSASRTITTGP